MAYSYASQKKVEDGVVLEPITLGAKGERDGGAILPFTVLTNCDYIKIFKDGIYIDTYYPNKEKFPKFTTSTNRGFTNIIYGFRNTSY